MIYLLLTDSHVIGHFKVLKNLFQILYKNPLLNRKSILHREGRGETKTMFLHMT